MVEKKPETPGYTEGSLGRVIQERKLSPNDKLLKGLFSIFTVPVDWFHEKVVLPNRKKDFHYYHQQYKRVPTVDQCYTDDYACIYEADEQYKRDRLVDSAILNILRHRYQECLFYKGLEKGEQCMPLKKDYDDTELNWFIKYGEMGIVGNVVDAYMKQKHRMIFERRQAEKKAREERANQ